MCAKWLCGGFRFALIVLCAGLLPGTPLRAGSGFWLYPLARAFGSPSESELAKCRDAFRQFQTRNADCVILVEPMLRAKLGGDVSEQVYKPELAERLIKRLSGHVHGRLSQAPDAPAVPAAEFLRNQLRYCWNRGYQYANYTANSHPAADYVLFTEVWVAGHKVVALQIYLVNASGQIVYCRLFNSHQFGENLFFNSQDWMAFLVRHFLRDLERDAMDVFPKYGVG